VWACGPESAAISSNQEQEPPTTTTEHTRYNGIREDGEN
tara:strand:+ start:67 stop:183 length:117 start_codon:yes stop_codon:yes gene_type:complete